MQKPTNKRIAASTSFLTAGCLLLALPWLIPASFYRTAASAIPEYNDWAWWFVLATALAGSAMIVGGIGNIFRRPWVGALCGVSLYFVVCVIRAVFFIHVQ